MNSADRQGVHTKRSEKGVQAILIKRLTNSPGWPKQNHARTRAEEQPSQENHERLQQGMTKFLRTKLKAIRRSWRDKTAALSAERGGRKSWNITKQLNGKDSRDQKITLE